MSANSRSSLSWMAVAAVSFVLLSGTLTAYAQVTTNSGDPKPDINIVGPTRDPADIRDEGLKQQNEPACAVRPGNSDCVICFFNDYRTVDIPGHEDAWIGQAESCDATNTWTSRIVPGHPNHAVPIDGRFAADPRAIALPGMTIHGFIAGYRDQDRGVIAVQHWLENNKDDFDYYEPGRNTLIVDLGTEGRFIDKPDFLAVLDESEPQGKVSISTLMENPALGTITREYPAGTLYAAYAVFTGSQSVKLLVKTSNDWGVTWRNKVTKLTESQNLVTGITLTHMNGIVMAMWRQVLDGNDVDAMYYSVTTNGGNGWSKPQLLTNICKFDQPSATFANQVTFRTNDFPWLANDGKNIYAFYTERLGSCATGTPKIVMRHTQDGQNWSAAQAVSNGPGAEFMPAAFGARGKVQVAWYDTRREAVPVTPQQPFVADFIPETGVRVNRKVDVYTARVTSDAQGGNVQVSDAVRVSQYRSIASATDPDGPLYEIEASFSNAMMYKTGLLAFLGDYFTVTAEEFRPTATGGWESNSSPLPAPHSNLIDFFIAYTDHRDVRGDILFGDGGNTKPYTPPQNVPAATGAAQTEPATESAEPALVADAPASDDQRRSAEGLEDTLTDPAVAVCQFGTDADRTRDANIYGALIRDRLRLSSPVGSRPLSGILRAIPFVANNVTGEEQAYRLFIANQPGADPIWHRASFRQKPDRAPFSPAQPPVLTEQLSIKPNSSVARTVFLVSPDIAATVDIQIFDGACSADADAANPGDPLAFATECDVLGNITVGGVSSTGDLRQPDYLSTVCAGDPDCANVLVTELHNPLIENPLIENPLIENPLIENPLIENMELQNPLIENPLIENPLIENYGFENPLIENPLIENPLIENPLIENPLIENPLIENPLIENSTLPDGTGITYADVTAVIRNDGNVTTSYNVDVTASGFASTAGGAPVSQLILWKQYVYGTARDCKYVPEARNQVLATINNPDNELSVASINEPFAGEGSMILAPGEQGFITYRFWGTVNELATARIKGLTASAQAANCDEFDDEFGPPAGQEDNFYTCEDQIFTNRELILLEFDSTPPTFDGLVEGATIPAPPWDANTPGGACFTDPVTQLGISASDESALAVDIACFNAEGDEICTLAGDPNGLSVPVSNLAIYPQPLPSPMTCVATDAAGNQASINLLVAVYDNTPPFFTQTAPNPTQVDADPQTGTAQLTLENGFAAQDVVDVDPGPTILCETTTGLGSGDQLPAGNNQVNCVATDASGNASLAASYIVEVRDVTQPIVSLNGPSVQLIEAGEPYIELGATAWDNVAVDGNVVVNASAVNTNVPGDYVVTYTARDTSGNETTVPRTVRVVDTTPPAFDEFPVDIVIAAQADGTVTVTFVATAIDNSGAIPVISCDPPSGSTFAVGDTSVTCTATDTSGNSASRTFTVTVVDATPPVVVVPTSPLFEVLQGPAGSIVNFDSLVSVTDLVDPAPTLTCVPASGSMFPPGETTVTCTGRDASGNTASADFVVAVGYIGDGIYPNKLSTKAGSSNPMTWAWRDATGSIVDTSGEMQMLEITDCGNPATVIVAVAGDPGASGFRVKSDLAWEFNWQSDNLSGAPLPRGTYCARVTTEATGQSLGSPPIRLR
jgi:hypothetical protein